MPAAAGAGAHVVDMKYLVRALVKYRASDIHVKPGRPPIFRINGDLVPAKMADLTPEQAQKIVFGVMTEKQVAELHDKRQIDLSFRMADFGRFRANVFYQKGLVTAAIRMIPMNVPRLEDLSMPSVLKDLCARPRGLLLVTGATGSGKSTTLSAMVQHINETSSVHVLTIEDPIEFVYRDMKASITQREVGTDTLSLKDGLHAAMRQDPDVILIGELRGMEMIQLALMAAETGHLVLSTLHTNDARSTIDRILEVFPAEGQNQVRIQLAASLLGVVSQQLVPTADGKGRAPAVEVLVKSPAIEQYILKNELDKINEAIEGSNSFYKMQTMNQALEKLIKGGKITLEEAMRCSNNPDDLQLRVSGITRGDGYGGAGAA